MDSKYALSSNLKVPFKPAQDNNKHKFAPKTISLFVKRKSTVSPNELPNSKMRRINEPKNKCVMMNKTTPANITYSSVIKNGLSKNEPYKNNLNKTRDQRNLPIWKCRLHLMREIKKCDSIVLMGETGSGKTTQIPQFLLAAGYAKNGIIAVTQPRRVAAITIAKHVAKELCCTIGNKVGYTVRFEDCTSSQTQICFMTDGCLLREALTDRLLMKYSVIMLDEVHERTLNTDVLFGIVKEAQMQREKSSRNPLKILATSATMDIDRFSDYFNVKGLYLEGRTHPVRVMHAKESQKFDYLQAVLITFFDYHRNNPIENDVLIFLTGQEEIEIMAHQIRLIAKTHNSEIPPVRVFSLYAQLPQNKQLECFLPTSANVRKVIISTNIAETSITIPGIRCVIDCGFVKNRVYNAINSLDILRIMRISKAQAWQRCGRAGREAPGICYRTYTKDEMNSFAEMPKPEILRSNISSVMLQLLALSIDIRIFDFIDRPSSESVESAYKKLENLGAILNCRSPELTTLGKQMAQFPLDPRYSKLILNSSSFGCTEEILSLVAILSGENIFITNTEKRQQASFAHSKFYSPSGDHLTLLSVFNTFRKTDKKKLWCHENFLNTRNLMYAEEVRSQLLDIVKRLGLPLTSCGNNYEQVRKCLISGLFENIAKLSRDNYYLTLYGRLKAKIHPSSVLHGVRKPSYVIFSEIVLTERNYLRVVTDIEPEWISEVITNKELLKQMKHPLR